MNDSGFSFISCSFLVPVLSDADTSLSDGEHPWGPAEDRVSQWDGQPGLFFAHIDPLDNSIPQSPTLILALDLVVAGYLF